MNLENQALDLCKARMKASDDDHSSAFISEELVLHNSIKFIDNDAEGPDSGHEDKSDKEELLKNNGTFLSVPSHIPEESSTQETESLRSVNDDEDMDIGVDLSLDESGVLEPDPVTVLVGSHSAASVVSERDKDRAETLEADPSSSTDAEASSSSLSSDQQEGAGPKPGGKRVTFPPDKDIVSGSVEPKDPWRHGEFTVFYLSQTRAHTHTLQVSQASLCLGNTPELKGDISDLRLVSFSSHSFFCSQLCLRII